MTEPARWRVYLDANFFIRFVESSDDRLVHVFEQASEGTAILFTSELTVAELLVNPMRNEDLQLENIYRELLTSDDGFSVVPVSREVLVHSARIRATVGNKLPDAIHVATAVTCSCNLVLSSDARLRLPGEIVRIDLDDTANLDLWP